MQHFDESGLTLAFGDEWIVRRYDAHPFYALLSGRGYRGVDFVLLHRRRPRAVWVEVKNYRRRFRDETPAALPGYVRDPARLATELAAKAHDTRRGLRQIDRHYRARWWWPLWGAFALAQARRARYGWQRRLRAYDHVFFPLLAEWCAAFAKACDAHTDYAPRLELDTAYPELPGFDAEGFRESVFSSLRERMMDEG